MLAREQAGGDLDQVRGLEHDPQGEVAIADGLAGGRGEWLGGVGGGFGQLKNKTVLGDRPAGAQGRESQEIKDRQDGRSVRRFYDGHGTILPGLKTVTMRRIDPYEERWRRS